MGAINTTSTSTVQPATRTFAGKGGMPKVITAQLCLDELFRTDGTATPLATLFDIPEIREYGPMINQLRVYYVCEGATTNFQCRVTSAWSILGRSFSAVTVILANQAGIQTGVLGTYVTTSSAFGPIMRYAVEVSNSTGAAIESGRVTVFIEIELKS